MDEGISFLARVMAHGTATEKAMSGALDLRSAPRPKAKRADRPTDFDSEIAPLITVSESAHVTSSVHSICHGIG